MFAVEISEQIELPLPGQLLIFFRMYLCFVCMGTMYVPTTLRVQKKVSDALGLPLHRVVNTMWVLGTGPGSSEEQAASALHL